MVKKLKFYKLFLLIVTVSINCNNQKIFLNSIPKCGTHLASQCISLLINKPFIYLSRDRVTPDDLPMTNNSPILWHVLFSQAAVYNLQKNNYLGFFIYRDPRDKIVSNAYWIMNHSSFSKSEKTSITQIITKLIPLTKAEYNQYSGWFKVPFFYSFKFEDLIGPRGGGTSIKQRRTIINICKHLKINPDKKTVDNCIKNLFGKAPTFREGKIGSWKKHFTKEQTLFAKQELGQLLIDLGYEKDLNW